MPLCYALGTSIHQFPRRSKSRSCLDSSSNLYLFSHIEEYDLPPMYNCALLWLHSVFSSRFIKTTNLGAFCGFNHPENFFSHSPLSKQRLALTMATAMCLCQSATSPKHQNSAKCQGCRTFLASLLQWVGAFHVYGYPTFTVNWNNVRGSSQHTSHCFSL